MNAERVLGQHVQYQRLGSRIARAYRIFLGQRSEAKQSESHLSQYQSPSGYTVPFRHLAARMRSKCQKTCLRSCSHDVARLVKPCVREAKRGNHPVAPPLGGTERYEKHLIFVKFHYLTKLRFELNSLCGIQITLEHRKLQVVSVILTDFEDASQTLVVGDVITDQESGSHGGGDPSACHEGRVLGNFTGQIACKQPKLQLQDAAIAYLIVENGVSNQRAHSLFVSLKEQLPAGG
jgi:hypothetical protein